MATNFDAEDYSTRTSLTSLDGTASREIAQLPAGPLRMAVGAELRRETYVFSPSAELMTGDIAGLGGNELAESASRTAQAAYRVQRQHHPDVGGGSGRALGPLPASRQHG
jgi:iron complex outermembrane receptor protein